MKICDPPSVPPATKPHLFRLSVHLGLSPEAVGPRPGTVCSFSTWAQDRPLKQGCKAWEDALHPQPRESRLARLPPPEPSQCTLVCFTLTPNNPTTGPLLQADQAPNSCLDYCSSLPPQQAEREAAACTHKYVMECGPREQECGPRKKNTGREGERTWATDVQFCWDHVRSCLESTSNHSSQRTERPSSCGPRSALRQRP